MPNILLADDHDLVRETISAYLSSVDEFHVSSVSDLDAALEQMSGLESFDLLILDYQMRGMNGLDGLERAKKQHPTVKVALMSGIANRDVASAAMARGADGFMPKSLSAMSLVNAIKFILSGERYFLFEFSSAQGQCLFRIVRKRVPNAGATVCWPVEQRNRPRFGHSRSYGQTTRQKRAGETQGFQSHPSRADGKGTASFLRSGHFENHQRQ
jgi:CheY-like chemotaxis protein